MKNSKLTLLSLASVLFLSLAAHASDKGEHFMHDALGDLEKAQKKLHDHPERDFGGHRGASEKLVADAIGEVNAGLEWAKAHPKETK